MAKLITDAIVVRAVDYGEADRVVTLITRDAGKLSALARGARRSRKRFGGALELFGAGEAVLSERRGDLMSLETLHSRRGFPHLALDVARLAHAAYACELARELSPEHAAEPRIHSLLDRILGLLDEGDAQPALLRVFELALLDAAGFAPSFDRCVGCGGGGGAGDSISPRSGGLLCRACGRGEGAMTITASARAALLRAQAASLEQARTLVFGPGDAEAARDVLSAIVREHLGKVLRSLEFIAKINGAHLRG